MIITCLKFTRKFCSVANNSEIMKYLCVAEKNDAAKTISSILSHGSSNRREGYSPFNKIYEFEMNFRGQQSKIVFTSVSGHLLTHEFSNAYRNWQSCSPEQLFDAPVVKKCPDNFVKIKQTLEREVRTCHGLIIWTDCDREGENIGYEIIDVCKAIKPSIPVFRAKFSDMTGTSINRAMNNLIQPDLRVSQAVDVRSELDLRIGAAFTRFQTMRLRSKFPDSIEQGGIVSYGSCQIPTLGFVAQRYKEIENFIPKAFWKIKLNHKIDRLTVEFNWARNRLFDKSCCEAFLMICQADGQVMIQNVQQKPKNKWRPQPMDTVELEKTGSRKLKMSAKEIMTIAEKLYQKGYMSYPRTETNKFPKEMNLVPLVEMQTADPNWGDFANTVLQWGPNPRNGNKSDQAHPPIHPTKFVSTLQGNEKRVYELIVRHFLACVSRDAVGSETVVNATIGNEDFTATGLIILERNYLDVYPYDRWSGKEIHNYEVGHTFRPTELDLHEGATNPPGMLTEADLIALMEKHGIGTDATHADHISTIKERGYIGVLEQGHLVPGTLGMGLVEGYESMSLQFAQPKLRAGLEVDLKNICDGVKNPQEVLAIQIQKYKECYQIIAREAENLDRAIGQRFNVQPRDGPAQNDMPVVRELFTCPKCKTNSMTIRTKKDSTQSFIGCSGYPQCKNAIWVDSVKELVALDETCGACGVGNKKIKLKFTQVAMLGQVDENPAFSRIEGTHYITCIVCDGSLRRLLDVPADCVKVLGNIVGATSRPVQQNSGYHRRPVAQDPPSRGFSSNAFPPNTQYQGRGRSNNDDDDDRPSGGGGAVAVGRQNAYQGNQGSNGASSGWNQGGNANSSGFGASSAVSNRNQGWSSNSSGVSSNVRNNNGNQGWKNTSSGWGNQGQASTGDNSAQEARKKLGKLPNMSCDCKKNAAKYTVSKEGPNKGRPFYSCETRACKFFKWADEAPQGNAQTSFVSNAPTTNNSRNNYQQTTATARKCGNCKIVGHDRRKCPHL